MKNPFKRYGVFGWNSWHLISHPWVIFVEIYFMVKWFIQRGVRGYSDRDAWDLSSYISSWMPAAIKKLSDGSFGYPSCLCTHTFVDFCNHHDSHLEDWKKILKKIEEGFRAARIMEDSISLYTHPRFEEFVIKKKDEGLSLFSKYFFALWD